MARRSAGAAAEAQYRVSSRPRDSRDDQCLGVREEQTAARSISRVRRRCCEVKLAATVAAPVGGRRRRRRRRRRRGSGCCGAKENEQHAGLKDGCTRNAAAAHL